jgi:hypothetical protein
VAYREGGDRQRGDQQEVEALEGLPHAVVETGASARSPLARGDVDLQSSMIELPRVDASAGWVLIRPRG